MVLTAICIPRRCISSSIEQLQTQYLRTMTDPTPPQKRKSSSHINELIAACNKNDRFKLLEDDGVLPANLDNPIHPIFCWFDCEGPMKRTLQLASQFLTYDSLLAFFVPLLYGRELTALGGTPKTYLSDPLANVSDEKKAEYIAGVREALHCLGHSIYFQFTPPVTRVYARTILNKDRPPHTSTCCPAFQTRWSASIEIAEYFKIYYDEEGGYAAASRCAQFRHDFLLASTLIHEVVHAFGVLRRGNLNEPHIRPDSPDTEWGWAWENFMFGSIINPQDRTGPGTHLLMRKIWADQKVANDAGGKEYCDVPMSYVAQWFRKETWNIIDKGGPTAIPPPTTHFKIQSSKKYSGWVVSSDCRDVRRDLVDLDIAWKQKAQRAASHSPSSEGSPTPPPGATPSIRILWCHRKTESLQKSNVPYIVRVPKRVPKCLTCGQILPGTKETICGKAPGKAHVMAVNDLTPVSRSSSPSSSSSSRKRRSESSDKSGRAKKVTKR